ARSKGGSSSSVAALIAVETNALISALRAVAVAASMTMTIATVRMTIPATDPALHRTVSHARASVRRLGASLQPAAVGRQSPLRLRSICDMVPRLPRSNALKLFPRCHTSGRCSRLVMPGLDPGIHRKKRFIEEDGLPGHKRVHARLPTRYARQ